MEATLIQRTARRSSPESIDDDLRLLWRDVARETPVARAVMANLILFVADPPDGDADLPLDDVIRRHPSRVIVLRHSRAGARQRPSGASIAIIAFGPPHARYAVEEIALWAACGDTSLPSIVRRFTRGDLPTSLWWTDDLSQAPPIPALTTMAQQLVFDSTRWRDVVRGMAAVAALLDRPDAPRLADLNWRRLASMRHALVHAARTLLPSDTLPHIEVRHRPGDAALASLLVGWIAARMAWPDTSWPVSIEEGRHHDEVLSVTTGTLSVAMTATRIVARVGHRPAFQTAARRESTADAVAAELTDLAPDVCLREAITAVARYERSRQG
jgi:glucose-6-phosphate dehydrogenase assembly protein OpcA